MANLTHFVKAIDSYTSTSVSAEEHVAATVAWSDLTGAGFAASDDVLVFVTVKLCNSGVNNNTSFQIGFGTTYAGRSSIADSLARNEPVQAAATNIAGFNSIWFDRRTLTVNENIYFSKWTTAGTATYKNFKVFIIKLADLSANDFGYADATHSGNAASTYGTGGASFSTPAAGDWLIFCCTHWLIDSTTADLFVAISAGGSDYSEIQLEGEDTADEYTTGTIAYRAALGSGQTVRARYRTDDGASHDCDRTAVFGIRLDAFEDHWGAHTTDTLTIDETNWGATFATNASYSKTSTGPFIAFGWPICSTVGVVNNPSGRISLDGGTNYWPTEIYNRNSCNDNGAAMQIAPVLLSYEASVANGSKNVLFALVEEWDANPTYNCDEQISAIFSLTLASSGPLTVNATGYANTTAVPASMPMICPAGF